MKILSSLKGLNSRLEQAEEMISKLADKATEILQFEQIEKKKMNRTRETCIKHTNIHQRHPRRKKGPQNI